MYGCELWITSPVSYMFQQVLQQLNIKLVSAVFVDVVKDSLGQV
jgi:hypothetical protein